jgi:hypothetical protein
VVPEATGSAESRAAPSTTIDPRPQIVGRLQEILRVRDRALLTRNAALLDDVYTDDCNCLRDGRAVIRELRQKRVVWKGLASTLAVQTVDRVADRQWLVVGVLRSPPVRIESESGKLVRLIPAEGNLLRFALARPPGATDWLLGHTSVLRRGG